MAWTITQTINKQGMMAWKDLEIIEVKLACISDASGTDTDLNSNIMQFAKNSFLWTVVCDPGSGGDAPAAAFQLQIQNHENLSLFDTGAAGVSETADSFHVGSVSLGMPPPFFDTISFVCGTLGDTNTADFYLTFAKGM